MKKRVLILSMIFAMAFTGCGAKNTEITKSTEITSEKTTKNKNYKSAEDITLDDLYAHGENPASDFDYLNRDTDKDIVINSYIGDDPIVVVPNEIDGKKVVDCAKAFANNKTIVAVKLNDNITEMTNFGFINCENLKYIVTGKSMKTIKGGFIINTNMQELILNDGLETFGDEPIDCVSGKENLKVKIPESVTTLGAVGVTLQVKKGSKAEEIVKQQIADGWETVHYETYD